MQALAPDDPRMIGDYRLLGRLGAGGMGRVYLGRSRGGRMVAIKLVHTQFADDRQFRRRFRREVEAARQVGGEWTAPVLDADTDSATPWVATGYVAGPTLEETVERYGPLPTASVLALAAGLARALQAVHACGLIHRDLKPSNVLVTIDGPRVIDFGIVRSVDASVATRPGALIGSPPFMSPEQVHGAELGPASDVFSLGSVLAYAATGRRPFGKAEGGLPALLFQVIQGDPDLGELSGPVRDLVDSCLAKGPEERPTPDAILGSLPPLATPWLPAVIVSELGRHATELLDLEAPEAATSTEPTHPAADAAAGEQVTAPPSGRRPTRRTRWYLATGAAAAVAVLAGGLVATLSDPDPASGDPGSGPSRPPRAVGNHVPAAMIGTWQGWIKDIKADAWWLRRITLSKGEIGTEVARMRLVNSDQMCEYVGKLSLGAPSVSIVLQPRLTRSVPQNRCGNDVRQTLSVTGDDIRWSAGENSAGQLLRTRAQAAPQDFRGIWSGRTREVEDPKSAPIRRRIEIGDGAVGEPTVKVRTVDPQGVTCDSVATLISTEDRVVHFFPHQLLSRDARCALGGLQSVYSAGDRLVNYEDDAGNRGQLLPSS